MGTPFCRPFYAPSVGLFFLKDYCITYWRIGPIAEPFEQPIKMLLVHPVPAYWIEIGCSMGDEKAITLSCKPSIINGQLKSSSNSTGFSMGKQPGRNSVVFTNPLKTQ